MTEILTSAQMRAIEKAAIDSGEVTGLELMERAGAGVVAAIMEEWPELEEGGAAPRPSDAPRDISGQKKAVVLCGPGNNGGDGFVVARLLKGRGWEVEVFLYVDPEKLPPDAKVNYERWAELGEVIRLTFPNVSQQDIEHFEDRCYQTNQADLIIDAAFGIGLSRPIEGMSPLFGYNDIEVGVGKRLFPAKHVAVDLPSGMRSDGPNEVAHLCWFLADLTVTFHSLKPAHVDPLTASSCGKVVVVDIGLSYFEEGA